MKLVLDNFFKIMLDKNDLVAAPMAGITSPPFRRMLREFFDGLAYSEMVSVEGIKQNNPKSTEYMDVMAGDNNLVVQLFGGKADSYIAAMAVAEEYNSTHANQIVAYDVNMGCPVKKVVKTGGGCAFLQNIDNAACVIRAVRSATSQPFSIKTRIGWDDTSHVYMEMLDIAQSEGANAFILHARTRSQMFGGEINYDALANTVAKATIPVIGNGNVTDYESYMKIKETGVNGVMIGRAIMHTPWIFQAIRQKQDPLDFFPSEKRYDLLMQLLEYMREYSIDSQNRFMHYLNIIRKIAVWFSKGLQDAAQFRVNVYRDNNSERFIKSFKFFLNGISGLS